MTTMIVKKNEYIYLKNSIMKVIDVEFFKPGKGHSVYRVVLKDILTGLNLNCTLRDKDKILFAKGVKEVIAEFTYRERNAFIFTSKDGEILECDSSLISEELQAILIYALNSVNYKIILDNEKVISIILPPIVTMKVTDIVEYAKRQDAAQPSYMKVKLEGGIIIKTPHFISIGDRINFDPEKRLYLSREN